jgi:hypothetical protein
MSTEIDSPIVPMDTMKTCTELCQTTDVKSDATDANLDAPDVTDVTDAKSVATDANSNTTNGKPEYNRGLECYVLDEYVIPPAPQQEKGEGGEQKEQKRGQNKHRPIFKQNNKAWFPEYFLLLL